MKKIAPVLGIVGTFLVAIGLFLKTGNLKGGWLLYNLGTLIISLGFLPWLIGRGWKKLNKYRRIERLLGILGVVFLLNGLLFRYMHWPGGSIMITLAVFLFIFGYLPLNFHLKWQEAGTRLQKAYALFHFGTIFLMLVGFTFKMMHWPGAGVGLMVGSLLLPLYLLFYFILRFRNQGKLPFDLGDLLLTILIYSIWTFVNSSQISKGALGGYQHLEDQYLQMNAGVESGNALIYESIDSLSTSKDFSFGTPTAELRRLSTECTYVIDSFKKGLYRHLLGDYYREGSNHMSLNYDQLGRVGIVNDYFILDGRANEIKEGIDHYKEGVLDLAVRNNIASASIGLGLETKDHVYGNGYTENWIDYIFSNVPVGSVIVNLSMIKQMVLLTESTVLNGLIAQMDLSGEALLLQEIAAKESEKAIQLKENEIARAKQQQELQAIELEQSEMATKQNRIMAIGAFAGVALVLVLLSISTRAFVRKQKDMRKLETQKNEISDKNEELNQQNEEISSQRDEIAAQRDEIEAQRDLVSGQKAVIEKSHEQLNSSIDYAGRLQGSILPGKTILEEYFPSHFVLFRPRDRVSGDFYWWSKVDGQLVIIAADCTGHGVPGAFMSMLGISLLREIVDREFVTKPEVILQKLRREVIRVLGQKGDVSDQKDGMEMAVVSINTKTLHCTYAGANNPLYLIRGGELKEFKADPMPVSYYDRMDRFTTHEIPLEEGDRIYMFSDGYADQFGGEKRKKFKAGAFKRLLTEIAEKPMKEQHKILTDTIVAWQGDFDQIDDMLVLGIHI